MKIRSYGLIFCDFILWFSLWWNIFKNLASARFLLWSFSGAFFLFFPLCVCACVRLCVLVWACARSQCRALEAYGNCGLPTGLLGRVCASGSGVSRSVSAAFIHSARHSPYSSVRPRRQPSWAPTGRDENKSGTEPRSPRSNLEQSPASTRGFPSVGGEHGVTESGRKGLFPRTACSAETQHGAAARYSRAELISPPTSPPVRSFVGPGSRCAPTSRTSTGWISAFSGSFFLLISWK